MNTSSSNPIPESRPQGPLSPESMALSVTRHALIAEPSSWRLLVAGIDTLDVGGFVLWDEGFSELLGVLEEKKAEAAGSDGIVCPLADCLVLPSAKPPNYRFHLQYPEFHLYIGKSSQPRNETPNVYVSINSMTLWNRGLYDSLDLVSQRISQLGGRLLSTKVSRLDLTADFKLSDGISYDFLRSTMVSRSRKRNSIEEGDQLETFYVGAKSSPIQIRIYNKGLEVRKDGTKLWFPIVWGIEDSSGVWRIEYQVRRPTLKSFRIDSPDDLLIKSGALWKYLTEKWFSLRLQDNKTTTRRTVHPFWKDVQKVADQFGIPTIPLDRDLSTVPADVKTCLAQLKGRVMTFAARTGCNSWVEACERLKVELSSLVNDKQFMDLLQSKKIQLGRTTVRQDFEVMEDENEA